jgi:hypothetical protein
MPQLIRGEIPELDKLERKVEDLEAERMVAENKVFTLRQRVAEAHDDDVSRTAHALNNGRQPPKPKEPQIREQLQHAEREHEILERRVQFAESERARFVAGHVEEIMGALQGAHTAEGEKIAQAAREALEALGRYHALEDEARQLQRLAPSGEWREWEPGEVVAGQSVTTFLGPLRSDRVDMNSPTARGNLEAVLQYLVSLGTVTEVGPVEDEGAA